MANHVWIKLAYHVESNLQIQLLFQTCKWWACFKLDLCKLESLNLPGFNLAGWIFQAWLQLERLKNQGWIKLLLLSGHTPSVVLKLNNLLFLNLGEKLSWKFSQTQQNSICNSYSSHLLSVFSQVSMDEESYNDQIVIQKCFTQGKFSLTKEDSVGYWCNDTLFFFSFPSAKLLVFVSHYMYWFCP